MRKLTILTLAALLCSMTACDKDKNEPSKPCVGTGNGYSWVDLGLSVKWATCNVGASSPEDYGNYYAWGETRTKANYDWSTYKYCSNGLWTGMTKYTFPDNQKDCIWYDWNTFIGDNNTTLDPEDDVAHVNWGGSWRIPTFDELNELINNCTWTWETRNGVNGYKVEGKNGNSIFLPEAGCRYENDIDSSYGGYWSSSLYVVESYCACYLYFDSGYVNWIYYNRYIGRSIRPVCP